VISKMYGRSIVPEINKTGLGGQITPLQPGRVGVDSGKSSFQQILEQKTQGLSFSAHAMKRLNQRNISLSDSDMNRLSSAVDRASGKGARESLVLLNDMAFVVSVSNRTVITAMDTDGMKENVVTNIDSAVIA